jgi:hypothetical protein
MDLELLGMGYVLPPPLLTIGLSAGKALLSWPVSNGTGFTLYSTTNLATAGSWTVTGAPAQTNGGQIVVTQSIDTNARGGLLQRP